MKLADLQQLAWFHQPNQPQTVHEAIGRLYEVVSNCKNAFEKQQLVLCQNLLEEALLANLASMSTLNLNADQAAARALTRLQQDRPCFYVYQDRVEIKVSGEVRGGWPLYSQTDYELAMRLAHELGCDLQHAETQQLELFAHVGSPE